MWSKMCLRSPAFTKRVDCNSTFTIIFPMRMLRWIHHSTHLQRCAFVCIDADNCDIQHTTYLISPTPFSFHLCRVTTWHQTPDTKTRSIDCFRGFGSYPPRACLWPDCPTTGSWKLGTHTCSVNRLKNTSALNRAFAYTQISAVQIN